MYFRIAYYGFVEQKLNKTAQIASIHFVVKKPFLEFLNQVMAHGTLKVKRDKVNKRLMLRTVNIYIN